MFRISSRLKILEGLQHKWQLLAFELSIYGSPESSQYFLNEVGLTVSEVTEHAV